MDAKTLHEMAFESLGSFDKEQVQLGALLEIAAQLADLNEKFDMTPVQSLLTKMKP